MIALLRVEGILAIIGNGVAYLPNWGPPRYEIDLALRREGADSPDYWLPFVSAGQAPRDPTWSWDQCPRRVPDWRGSLGKLSAVKARTDRIASIDRPARSIRSPNPRCRIRYVNPVNGLVGCLNEGRDRRVMRAIAVLESIGQEYRRGLVLYNQHYSVNRVETARQWSSLSTRNDASPPIASFDKTGDQS
jgi:hypothetical protein